MNPHEQRRPRILVGKLVASGNAIRDIAARRLDVSILYTKDFFNLRVVTEKIVGINTEKEKYRL